MQAKCKIMFLVDNVNEETDLLLPTIHQNENEKSAL